MILVEIVVVGLASYRIFRLIAIDTITQPVRERIESRGFWWEWLSCPWCSGFHITVLVSIAWFLWPTWTIYAAVPLAASTLVGVIGDRL